ncbi:MAG: phosphatidate cytidylyltransferase [Candidatus Promineifilaceae bacterium]
MFAQRAMVTATMGSLAVWLLYMGGWPFFVPVMVILLIGGTEYAKIAAEMNVHVQRELLLVLIAVQVLATIFGGSDGLSAAFIVSLFAALCFALWRYERGEKGPISAEWFATTTGVVFLGWMGSHFILMRNLAPATGSAAWQWTMLVIMTTWSADTGAYMVGSFLTKWIGRHALTPRLSPKKSVEGYVGGILFGLLFGWIVGTLIFGLPIGQVLGVSLFVTVLGTVGDLCVSMFKRDAQVKDSGVLFPGHGGALDRIDSIIWTTALAYYLLQLFL